MTRSSTERAPFDENARRRLAKFANLRAYLAFMWGYPGKKLLFMGGEIAQPGEWQHDQSVTWDVLDQPLHACMQRLIRDLNGIYGREEALQFGDLHPQGFEWAVVDDAANSVFGMLRSSQDRSYSILIMSNFTPVPRYDYRVGVQTDGIWVEEFNSDAHEYGGSGLVNGAVTATSSSLHGHPASLSLQLPPSLPSSSKALGDCDRSHDPRRYQNDSFPFIAPPGRRKLGSSAFLVHHSVRLGRRQAPDHCPRPEVLAPAIACTEY